jgi:drug/metabolite transporter (DMT)-like permease
MIVERLHHLRAETGLVSAASSAAAFGTSGTLATSLLRTGWTPGAAVAARLLVAAAALTIPALHQLRGRPGGLRGMWPTLILYGLVPVAGGQLCYFEAVQHLSVAVALLLEYSGALMVVAWMWARHRQVPTVTTAAGALAAVAGLALVLDLIGHHHLDPAGLAWGLAAAVGLAVYFVVSSGGPPDGGEPLPPLVVAWGGLGLGAVSMLAAGAAHVVPFRAPRREVILGGAHVSWLVPMLGIGLVAAALAYVTGIAAARALGARVASFVGLAEVLFAAVYAWVLLGQSLSPRQLAGAVLVVAGIVLVRLGEPGEEPAGGGSGPEDALEEAVDEEALGVELVA